MVGAKISELPLTIAPLSRRETLAVVQEGQTRSMTIGDVRGGDLISVRDFGAVGDGIADDTPAFRAMHDRLVADQKQNPSFRSVILLPPGHYRYTWNRWLWDLRDVTLLGYGAALECINAHPRRFECYPLVTNRTCFQSLPAQDQSRAPDDGSFGHLMFTAGPGELVLRLKDRRDIGHFTTGQQVLVMSYDQQFSGYPPNCRYFEYAKVSEVSGDGLTLDRPLRHLHRDDYPELPSEGVGRARVIGIDGEETPCVRKQRIFGVRFLPNANINDVDAQYVLAQGVMNFVARDCEMPSFVASVGGDFTLQNCAIDYCEPDKLANSVTLDGCEIGNLSQATGLNQLVATRSRFRGKVNVQARHVTFDACIFDGAALPGDFRSGVDLGGFAPSLCVSINNSLFHGKNGADDCAVGPVGSRRNASTCVAFTAPLSLTAAGALLFPFADARTVTLLRSLEVGGLVLIGAEAAGQIYGDGRFGCVESITATENGACCTMSWTRRPALGDLLIVPRVKALSCEGNSYQALVTQPPTLCMQTFETDVVRSETFVIRACSDFAEGIWYPTGLLRSVSVDIVKAYDGDGVGAFLRIEKQFPPGGGLDMAIDLRQIGHFEFTPAAKADSDFIWSVRLSHAPTRSGVSARPSGAQHQLARYRVTLNMINPFVMG